MRVAVISPVFPHPRGGVYLGIERHALELTRLLRRRGCDVTVFTTFWNGGNPVDRFEDVTIRRTTDLSHEVGRLGSLFDLHYFTWGKRLLRDEKHLRECDALHALAPLSCTEALVSMGHAVVTHFHHYEDISRPVELLYKPFHHRIERAAYRHSTLMAVPSKHSARWLHYAFGVPEERIRVVPHGVDLIQFSPRSRKTSGIHTLLCVGAHEPRKGYSHLWHALNILKKDGYDFQLISVGTASETSRLKALAVELGIESRIHFLGYVPYEALPALYQQADLFVHPSLEEGFGMVLVEAMASGVPIVASNAGAIPEVVGDAGILVPPRDPAALADAMQRVLSDTALSEFLARKGRARAEALFSWESVGRRTMEVYKEAIELAGHVS